MDYRKNLFIISLISIICYLLNNLFNIPTLISTLSIVLFYIIYIILPKQYSIYNAFFMIPFITLFDKVGMSYTLNICILISFIKDIASKDDTMFNKKQLLYIILLLVIEFLLSFFYQKIDFKIIPFISLISSYLYLIVLNNKIQKIKFNYIFESLFYGIIISSICYLLLLFSTKGILISSYSRFTGLFRDPNYYSFFIILLMFSSFKVIEEKNKNLFNYYFVILLIFGLLSISKMFLLSVGIGLALKIISLPFLKKKFNKLTKKRLLIYFSTIIILWLVTIYLNNISFFDSIFNSYSSRFKYQDLTTGRLDLSNMYLTALFTNPLFLFFGGSNTYYNYVIIDYMRSIGYHLPYYSTAHNTYLDLLLSWGCIGTIIFLLFIRSLIVHNKKNGLKVNYSANYWIFILIVLICFFSLSFLSADVFALIIFYIFSFSYCNEVNNNE